MNDTATKKSETLITLQDEFNKMFPSIIIFLGTVIIYLCIYKDYVRVGFNVEWVIIRLMYLPFVLATWKASKLPMIQKSKLYELPLWLAGLYITLFCTYFAFSTGGLKSDYAFGLIQFYFVLSILPLTPFSFYGLSITSLLLYVSLNLFKFGYAQLHDHVTLTKMLPLLIYSPIIYTIISKIRSAKLTYQNQLAETLISRDEVIKEQSKKLADTETKAAVGLMVAQIAHDIRSPIATLNIISSGMLDFSSQSISVIRDATSRINDIANNLLMRFCGKSRELTKLYRMNTVVEEAEKIITEKKFQYKDRQVDFRLITNISQDNRTIEICMSDYMRVISNLINNSVDAITKNGLVSLELFNDATHFYTKVTDNGIGMSKLQLENAFVQGVTTKSEGCGLGLFHAKSIIEAINGSISISSEQNVGTTISIMIPTQQFEEVSSVAQNFTNINLI